MDKKKAFIAAYIVLSQQGFNVTTLQVEDGSGYCYNFSHNGDKMQFIDLRKDEMTRLVFEAVLKIQ